MLSGSPYIGCLVTDLRDELFVALRSDGLAQVYEPGTERPQAEFQTNFRDGPPRAGICSPSKVLVTAEYSEHGVCGYGLPGGEKLWERRDLLGVQKCVPVPGRDDLICVFDCPHRSIAIAAESGALKHELHGMKGIWFSGGTEDQSPLFVQAADRRLAFSPSPKPWEISLRNSVLCAAYSPRTVAVSEMGREVHFFSFGDATSLNTFREDDRHVIQLAYSAAKDCFLGLQFAFNTMEGERYRLISFSLEGEVISANPVEASLVGCFLPSRGSYIGQHGEETDCRSGRVICRYDFG